MFTTTEKWNPIVKEIDPGNVNFEYYTLERIMENLDPNSTVVNDPVREVLNKFIRIFNWIYLTSNQNKKDLLFNKQTAIDDISSFLSSISDFLEQKLSIIFPSNKKIYETIVAYIFPQIYDTIFPL